MEDYDREDLDGELLARRIDRHVGRIPPEPPVGTWVMDRWGAVHYHKKGGWSPAPTGFDNFGVWEAMWKGRGPLVECSPWGTKERQDRIIENLRREVKKAAYDLNEAQRAYDNAKRLLDEQIAAHGEMNR